jgi:hypothetical protein
VNVVPDSSATTDLDTFFDDGRRMNLDRHATLQSASAITLGRASLAPLNLPLTVVH